MEQIGLLIISIHLSLFDQIGQHGMEREHGVDSFGTEQSDAFQAALGILRQGGNHQDFQRRAVFAECAGRLFKNLRFDKMENLGGAGQPGRAKYIGVPAFDDHNRAFNEDQIRRTQNERHDAALRLWTRVEHEKINVVLLLTTGLADVFATLTNKKFVLFEILAYDAFTNGGHAKNGLMDWWGDGVLGEGTYLQVFAATTSQELLCQT